MAADAAQTIVWELYYGRSCRHSPASILRAEGSSQGGAGADAELVVSAYGPSHPSSRPQLGRFPQRRIPGGGTRRLDAACTRTPLSGCDPPRRVPLGTPVRTASRAPPRSRRVAIFSNVATLIGAEHESCVIHGADIAGRMSTPFHRHKAPCAGRRVYRQPAPATAPTRSCRVEVTCAAAPRRRACSPGSPSSRRVAAVLEASGARLRPGARRAVPTDRRPPPSSSTSRAVRRSRTWIAR